MARDGRSIKDIDGKQDGRGADAADGQNQDQGLGHGPAAMPEQPEGPEAAVQAWEELEALAADIQAQADELARLEGRIGEIEAMKGPEYPDACYELGDLQDQCNEAKALMQQLSESKGGIIQMLKDAYQFEKVREVYVENFHERMAIHRANPGLEKAAEQAEQAYKEQKDALAGLKKESKAKQERVNSLRASHQAKQKQAEGQFQALRGTERGHAARELAMKGNIGFREAHPREAVRAEAELAREQSQGQGRQQEHARER